MHQVTPTRAFFRPGQPVGLDIRLPDAAPADLRVEVFHLGELIASWTGILTQSRAAVTIQVPADPRRGYLVRATCGEVSAFTAFDILDSWTEAPRYGYLYDFKPDRTEANMADTLDDLLALHVNGLQFYDWQYRHDTLLPPTDTFTDPLGRPLSLDVVRHFIAGAHARGMAAMPYTAIYAASPAFAAAHAEWALYDSEGQIVDFANGFLKLMAPQGAWQDHFVRECVSVLAALPFDGIHVDQYGEPRTGCDAQGNQVDLPQGFADTLIAIRQAIGNQKVLLFNLVHNWPVEKLAAVPIDFWYSELWPPATGLHDLSGAIRGNRALNSRPAVIAAYIPSAWEQTVYAAHCRILAAGGTHIAHGDHQTYLSDPYFPKAEPLSDTLKQKLRAAADFAVAYEEALIFAQDVTEQWAEHLLFADDATRPAEVFVRAQGSALYISMLRSVGPWTQALEALAPISTTFSLSAEAPRHGLRAVWCATPESPLPAKVLVAPQICLPEYPEWLLVCLSLEDL